MVQLKLENLFGNCWFRFTIVFSFPLVRMFRNFVPLVHFSYVQSPIAGPIPFCLFTEFGKPLIGTFQQMMSYGR